MTFHIYIFGIVDLCKLRCFPPVALAWDSVAGLHIIPNIYSETLVVDSSPAFWDSAEGTDRTTVMILVRFFSMLRVL